MHLRYCDINLTQFTQNFDFLGRNFNPKSETQNFEFYTRNFEIIAIRFQNPKFQTEPQNCAIKN